MNTQRVGVFGASGYTGAELLGYLGRHPVMDVAWATADRNAGRTLTEVFPHLTGSHELVLADSDPDSAPDLDLAFLALPHGRGAEIGRALLARGTKVVDLSADWRLRDPSAYADWYGWTHPHPGELEGWVYGLTELNRERVRSADAVANPGCYPTAAVLALAPLLASGAVSPERLVVDAASGVSGAGRKAEADFLFSELDSSYKAYGVGRHRHTPEIEQELGVSVTFTPHLVPMARGLLVTCYASLAQGSSEARAALESAFKAEAFVTVLPDGRQPATKHVSGTNRALLGFAADERTQTAIVTCAIDNLGKGAAGQAVQNANLMLGLPETDGLEATAVYP